MVRVPSLQEVVRRYVRGCARTYLEGSQSLSWAVGCITHSGLDPDCVTTTLNQLRDYSNAPAWHALMRALHAPQP